MKKSFRRGLYPGYVVLVKRYPVQVAKEFLERRKFGQQKSPQFHGAHERLEFKNRLKTIHDTRDQRLRRALQCLLSALWVTLVQRENSFGIHEYGTLTTMAILVHISPDFQFLKNVYI